MFSARQASFAQGLLPLVVANGIVLALCAALYLGLAAPIKSNNLETEGRRLDIYKTLIRDDLAQTISDLRLLASGDGITDYLQTGSPGDLERAVRRAIFVSKDNLDYDQIRYIDENGQEIFRLNQNGAVVPKESLQSKANRPYFQKANALGPGQIYVSAIDLNVENGKVQEPFNPVLRLAMPVFDASGRHRGIYIINSRFEDLVTQLRNFVPRRAQRLRLLNAQGYWLAGPSPETEWGFDLPERSANSVAKTDPELWAQVTSQPSGQAPYHGGYFTWQHFEPRLSVPDKPVTLATDEDYIVLASVITPQEWAESLQPLRQTFVAVGALLVVLTTFMARLFQGRRRDRAERDRFFNLTRDLLCIAGFDGRFKRLNPAWRATLGYSPEEMVDHSFLDFVHPDDREATLRAAEILTKGNEVTNFENRYRCKDGSYRWLLWSSRPMPESQLIYASARDTTERKESEEALVSSQQMFERLFESAPDATILVDRSGAILRVNTQTETLFGYGRGELVGRSLEMLMPERYRAGHGRQLSGYFAAPRARAMGAGLELFACRKDGSEFPVDIMLNSLETPEGMQALAVIRDITNRKMAEERIRKLNGELNTRASLLEAANKELESFSYSVSHDLRAPLRHIHGFVEILQKSPLFNGQDSAQRQMSVIAKAAREMGLLIDDLLAFSRTGRAEMNVVQVNMRDVVEQCIRVLEPETAGRRVTWSVAPLAPIEGDPVLLRLAWANLLGNAVKYTRPRPEAKIEVGQEERCGDGGELKEVIYFVRDNGVGFDMRYASKLFGVFQRLHRTEDFEGTGIGLANVQRIIHRHGGKVWAHSGVDAGATFFFSLPVKAAQPIHSHANGKN